MVHLNIFLAISMRLGLYLLKMTFVFHSDVFFLLCYGSFVNESLFSLLQNKSLLLKHGLLLPYLLSSLSVNVFLLLLALSNYVVDVRLSIFYETEHFGCFRSKLELSLLFQRLSHPNFSKNRLDGFVLVVSSLYRFYGTLKTYFILSLLTRDTNELVILLPGTLVVNRCQ